MLFRKHLILWRAPRFQGKFTESLASLEYIKTIVERRSKLIFNEDCRDIIYVLAYTLRELNDSISAESYLRLETTRPNRDDTSSVDILA